MYYECPVCMNVSCMSSVHFSVSCYYVLVPTRDCFVCRSGAPTTRKVGLRRPCELNSRTTRSNPITGSRQAARKSTKQPVRTPRSRSSLSVGRRLVMLPLLSWRFAGTCGLRVSGQTTGSSVPGCALPTLRTTPRATARA